MGIDFYDRMWEEEQKEKERFGQRKNEIENELSSQRRKIEQLEKENTEIKSKLNHTHCVECSREFLSEINQLKLQLKVAGDKIDTLSSTNITLCNQIKKKWKT